MSLVCDNVLFKSSEKMSTMQQERVTLTSKAIKRMKVLERIESKVMSTEEGAESLGITSRQLRRLKKKYAEKGASGLVHGNSGRRASHALPEELKTKVLELHQEKYYDSNYTHYSELLKEQEGIKLSASSIGRILRSAGRDSKRRVKRGPKKHRCRERRSQAGMLWQTDATPYAWLGEERGRFALHAAIDDATGIVVGAVFRQNECAEGYARVMQSGINKYGIPLGLYSDKHTIFRSPNEKLTVEQELDGEQIPLSNFGKAMAELDIEHIKASTPQAKGRIERLWETLQDRLPVELRLLGVKTMDEANEALPELIAKHNRNYSVSPADENTAYIPLNAKTRLEHVFALHETRKISSGNSISYKGNTYVPAEDGKHNFSTRVTVEVRETYGGEIFIWHCGEAIELRKIDIRPRVQTKEQTAKAKVKYKPAANHPWRNQSKGKSENYARSGVAATY